MLLWNKHEFLCLHKNITTSFSTNEAVVLYSLFDFIAIIGDGTGGDGNTDGGSPLMLLTQFNSQQTQQAH